MCLQPGWQYNCASSSKCYGSLNGTTHAVLLPCPVTGIGYSFTNPNVFLEIHVLSHVLTALSLFTYLYCFATEVTLALANTVEPCLMDTPEKQSSMIVLTLCLVMNTFTYVCVQSKPLKLNPDAPVFHKADRFPNPSSIWSVQFLVDSKAGPYNY